MKELQEMDDNRLVKYLGIIRTMEQMNKQEEEEVKTDDVTVSARGEESTLPTQSMNPMPEGTGEQQQISTEIPDEQSIR